jgi:2-dehydropantoate 2-reductase
VVLTIQNGVGSADELAVHVAPERLCIGVAKAFGAIMKAPGHAFHNSMNDIRIGAFGGLPSDELDQVVTVWRDAGFNAAAVTDVLAMQWEKLICNVAYSAPCALTGMSVGELMDDPDMGPVSRAAATEAWTIARALGIAVKVEDPVALVRDFAAGMPHARPSLLQDLAAGRPTEISVINGAVPLAAARIGLEAPVNTTLAALVRQKERAFAPA